MSPLWGGRPEETALWLQVSTPFERLKYVFRIGWHYIMTFRPCGTILAMSWSTGYFWGMISPADEMNRKEMNQKKMKGKKSFRIWAFCAWGGSPGSTPVFLQSA
jgi:hypothetical protein